MGNINNSRLHIAAQVGKTEEVRRLIKEEGVDPNILNKDGDTPLHYAAWKGRLETAKCLVSLGANFSAKNKKGSTPMHYASDVFFTDAVDTVASAGMDLIRSTVTLNPFGLVKSLRKIKNPHKTKDKTKFEKMVKFLTEIGADCEAKDNAGNTPLHLAAKTGRSMITEYLISTKKADVNIPNEEGDTALHMAAKSDELHILKQMVKKGGGDCFVKNKQGNTLLHLAAKNCSQMVTAYLIEKKNFNVNERNNADETPLLLAAEKGSFNYIMFLIEKGADLTARDENGSTLMHIAARNTNNTDLLSYLITKTNNKLDVNSCNNDGETPLFWAIAHDALDSVKLLIENGADYSLECNNKNGDNVMIVIVQMNRMEILRYLIEERKINCNKVRNVRTGMTAIHCAVDLGNLEAIKLLVKNDPYFSTTVDVDGNSVFHFAAGTRGDKGAPILEYLLEISRNGIDFADKHGCTPIFQAVKNGNIESAKVLLRNGADIEVIDRNGNSLLHIAKSLNMVKLLLETKKLDPNRANKEGKSAAFVALEEGQFEIVNELKKEGAVVD